MWNVNYPRRYLLLSFNRYFDTFSKTKASEMRGEWVKRKFSSIFWTTIFNPLSGWGLCERTIKIKNLSGIPAMQLLCKGFHRLSHILMKGTNSTNLLLITFQNSMQKCILITFFSSNLDQGEKVQAYIIINTRCFIFPIFSYHWATNYNSRFCFIHLESGQNSDY